MSAYHSVGNTDVGRARAQLPDKRRFATFLTQLYNKNAYSGLYNELGIQQLFLPHDLLDLNYRNWSEHRFQFRYCFPSQHRDVLPFLQPHLLYHRQVPMLTEEVLTAAVSTALSITPAATAQRNSFLTNDLHSTYIGVLLQYG